MNEAPPPRDDSPTDTAAPGGRRSSVAGRIESLGLPVILQFLSQKAKTGRLTLTRRDGQGTIFFRDGRIVHVASSSVRETFGNMLVCRGLVSETDLMEAIEQQHLSLDRKRLGTLLVEAGKVSQDQVERTVRDQMTAVLLELMEWPGGFFRFDPMQITGTHDVELSAQEFVSEGVSAEHLLLSLARQEEEAADAAGAEGADAAEAPAVPVSEILSDLPTPALRGEVTLTLMRFAEQTVKRGILYLVRGAQLTALNAFGFSGPKSETQHSLKDLGTSLAEASLLAEVFQSRESYLGPLGPVDENQGLLRVLGGRPAEILAVPLIVGELAIGVFYGDNGADGGAIKGARSLELVVAEAGLEMERQTVEDRLRRYKASVPERRLLSDD